MLRAINLSIGDPSLCGAGPQHPIDNSVEPAAKSPGSLALSLPLVAVRRAQPGKLAMRVSATATPGCAVIQPETVSLAVDLS